MIADSTIIAFDTYDNRIYAIGKGPSQITLTTPSISVPAGSQVVFSGTVTDIAAGTQEFARTTRFPNGVPAVSDESMGEWMKYVYQQFPRPASTTGVPVTISVVDANGNYREIGTTTTSSDGFYSLNWTPDIEGKYSVYASFTGSKSYYPSHAEAAFVAEPAKATPAPLEQITLPPTEMYFAASTAAIIIAIALVALLLLRKKA
jgi:hypothetical protein